MSAPASFLRAVEKVCDGRTAWEDVRQALSDRWPPVQVDACLEVLVRHGALEEAGHLLGSQARVGWMPQKFKAPLTEAVELHALKERGDRRLREAPATPILLRPERTLLASLLAERASERTFADEALPLQSFVNILWSAYGVLRDDADAVRRTVPSGGGLYGLHWFVALLRPMAGYAAGLYELRYHSDGSEGGALALLPRSGVVSGAWATLLTPGVLAFAHAVLYPVADLRRISSKYGNRALALALVETGHALQNAAIAAQAEGAETVVRGDTIEKEVLSCFGLGDDLHPMPSLVLGRRPTNEQRSSAAWSFEKVLVRSVPAHTFKLPLSTKACIAGPVRIGSNDERPLWATGRSPDARLSAVKAEAEAWERIGWASPDGIERARLRELPDAVDPRTMVAYVDRQYRQSGFPFVRWSDARRYPWKLARRERSGSPSWIMAQCVYALGALRPEDTRHPYTNGSTSGVAAFTDPVVAEDRALVELVERDAFARTWLSRIPPACVDESRFDASLRERLRGIRAAGYEISVHLLPCRLIPVVGVFTQRRIASFTAVATGAGFGLDDALDSALSETESKIQQAHGCAPKARMRAGEVKRAAQHGDYFQGTANFRRADWFASAGKGRDEVRARRPGDRFVTSGQALRAKLLDQGHELFFCDLTPSGASIAQGRTPLHVARAFVPGLLPIWFGHGLAPLGLWSRISGLREANVPMTQSIHPCT